MDETLLQDPEFLERHNQFRTEIDSAIDLARSAIMHRLRFAILLFDGWYLTEALMAEAARRRKKWIRLLKKNRPTHNTLTVFDVGINDVGMHWGAIIWQTDHVELINPSSEFCSGLPRVKTS